MLPDCFLDSTQHHSQTAPYHPSPLSQLPFVGMHWGALLTLLAEGTVDIEWPEEMDRMLCKIGRACTRPDPLRRPTALSLSRVSHED